MCHRLYPKKIPVISDTKTVFLLSLHKKKSEIIFFYLLQKEMLVEH